MELSTYSDSFQAQVGDNEKVVAAVFTTYRFEPEFFEQEVIPLMLDKSLAYSSDQRVKSLQVREALSQTGLPIEVFYDINLFRQQGTISPSMEYLHHGMRGDHSAFHAKLVFLLLENKDSGEQSLCVGAGSANLTIAGWWENIECQHWERVENGSARQKFKNQLADDVNWLLKRRQGFADSEGHALPLIAQFLAKCKCANGAADVSYYGLSSLYLAKKSRPAFMQFLHEAIKNQKTNYRYWTLEIISPYFAQGPDFDGHTHFFNDMGVREIRIFLPVNDQGEALCASEYYERLSQMEGIEWASWSKEMTKALGLKTPVNRTTHAKIYHLYNGKQSWVFVGSVNFTYKAVSENQEAGYFTQLSSPAQFLTPLRADPDKWCPEDQLSGADEAKSDDTQWPDLTLAYDWKEQRLTIALSKHHEEHAVACDILSPEGVVAVAGIKASETPVEVACNSSAIEALLKNTGFLQVSGCWLPSGVSFPACEVLAQQINWTHKPLDLPHLTPQEILQIYAGLSQERRNQVIELLKLRQLHEMGLSGESNGQQEHEDSGRQFFAEYAELFHAFRNLRKRMKDAYEQNRMQQVDYYLSGRGLDSLPTLLDSLNGEDRNLDWATIYLTLLCLIQVYDCSDYSDRPQVNYWSEQCLKRLKAIEASGDIQLLDRDVASTQHFFEWFRTQFFREYRVISDGDDHAAD